MSDQEHTLTGGCRCGRVRYQGRSAGPRSVVCGCRDCQRSSGSFVSVAVGFKAEHFEVTKGHDVLKSFADTGESGQPVDRFFCSVCGSPLFAKPHSYDVIVSVRAVTLDTPHEDTPVFAIFVENIPDWLTLPDAVVEEGKKLGD